MNRLFSVMKSFWRDGSGVILPYAALLLTVMVGLSALAIDAGRQVSLQTQMQAVADALALAGARELDQRTGAQDRARSAIDNLVSNGLTGLGFSGSIGHSVNFYSSLTAADLGYGGAQTGSDILTKFVGVTINPASIGRTFPVAGLSSPLSAGAQAIAGFTGRAACDIPPVFICNPYETAGMSDADATAALRTTLSDPANGRKLLRMDRSRTTPGHFGYLVPPDGCTGASCLKDWIAKTHPNTCYQTPSVSLNTGAMNNVDDAFNVRFDMYKGSLSYSADYAPSVNVRKGFMPGTGANKWCSADVPKNNPYYTLPIITNSPGTTIDKSNALTVPDSSIYKATNPLAISPATGLTTPTIISSIPSSTTLNLPNSNKANASASVLLSSKGATSGFPLDSNMYADKTIIYGNGDWNCLDYWKVNHQAAAEPGGCTNANPTVSRYQVYREEISRNLTGDWSAGLDGSYPSNVAGTGTSESGAPYCAGTGAGVDTTTGGTDRRVIFAAVINCTAQSGLITGGSTADNIPIADFAKFFMTQPAGVDNAYSDKNSLYGEMTGAIGSLDKVVIYNQVQLYR